MQKLGSTGNGKSDVATFDGRSRNNKKKKTKKKKKKKKKNKNKKKKKNDRSFNSRP